VSAAAAGAGTVVDRVHAPFGRRLLTVTGVEELGAYRVLRVSDPDGPAPAPGQFAMLAAVERWGGGEDERPYLPRAFSIARWAHGEAHFLLEDVGPGTNRLCELRAGDGLWALGPLGAGFAPPPHEQRAILVGGGVGIAPLAILQDALENVAPDSAEIGPASGSTARATGSGDRPWTVGAPAVTVLLGFREARRAVGAALLRGAQVTTDDGSCGAGGLVTELLKRELDRDAAAVVYACGPAAMLEAVRALCARREIPAQLALEAGMACGFGACYGCVVPARDGAYLRVCIDGPVIDAAELDRVEEHAGAPA
jgi:dihydroorotate dehydrogenase electron transfer subunit